MRSTVARAVVVGRFLLIAWPSIAAAQVPLDRILSHVNTQIITQSDVRQARLLQLVDDPSTDASVVRSLEDRLLILEDLKRAAPIGAATAAELAARRSEWEQRLGGIERARALQTQAGMSDSSLENWLRDDVRIQAYLKRQFVSISDGDRARATADWVGRLRLRAGLK